MGGGTSRWAAAAAGLVVLALVIRLIAAGISFGAPLAFDALDYDRHARSLAAGAGYPEAVHPDSGPSATRPPGYPFLLAGVYAVSGGTDEPPPWRRSLASTYRPDATSVDAARVAHAVIGTAIVALIGLIAFQLWGRRVALVALAIAAIYPPLILLGLSLGADLLFVLFELAAVAAALRAREAAARPLRWALAAGLLVGLAWLTRSNGWLLLPPLLLLVWTPRRSWAAAAALLAAALLTITPWTVRNAVVMDAFVPVSDNGGYTLAGTYNETAHHESEAHGVWLPAQRDPANAELINRTDGELEMARVLGREARSYMTDHPRYVAEVAVCNTLRLAFLAWVVCGDDRGAAAAGYVAEQRTSRTVAHVAILCFGIVALLALAGAFTRDARRAPLAFWLVPVLLWTTVFVLAANRFRAPLEPFLLLLAALAIESVRQRWKGSTPRA